MSDTNNTNNEIDTPMDDERSRGSLVNRLTDLAWAAGFVDGEGCITVVNQTYRPKNGKQRPPTTRFKFVINQNCRSTLDRLQKILNETGYLNEAPFTEGMNRRSYTLHYDGRHALRAIKKLEPYLHRKRQYVHVAEKLFEEGRLGQRPGRSGWDEETLQAREKWMTRLRRLH